MTPAVSRGLKPLAVPAVRQWALYVALRDGERHEDIRRDFGIGLTTIQDYRRRFGLPPRPQGRHWELKPSHYRPLWRCPCGGVALEQTDVCQHRRTA